MTLAELDAYKPKRREPAIEPPPPRTLDDIALQVRMLTYGEMIELASAIWNCRGEKELTAETLPGVLHAWSRERAHENNHS